MGGGGNRVSFCQKVPRLRLFVLVIITTNRLILFREIIAVYCENLMEHTVWAKCKEFVI
jgi:hypothetical protein